MNVPGWLATELDSIGERNAAREITRQAAVDAVRNAILARDDPAFTRGIVADFAARVVAAWHREHARGPRAEVLAGQSDLFPGLPARLYIRPGQAKAVILFTGHDWDTARAVLENRTTGAIDAAKADWEAFDAAYQRVRPLLSGGLTTADVQYELQHPDEAQAAAPSPA